ncbi:glucuronide permease [Streptococcus sp. V919]
MNIVIILVIFIIFLALAFPLLHLLASLSELRKGRNLLGNRLLLIGSSLATLSIFLYFFLPIIALSLWLIGCGLICYGAYWNGKQKENFHPAHHLIRIGIALVLTILLALVQ